MQYRHKKALAVNQSVQALVRAQTNMKKWTHRVLSFTVTHGHWIRNRHVSVRYIMSSY